MPNNTKKTPYTAMTADAYAQACALCWPGLSQPKTAAALGINLMTHRLWLKDGIRGDYQPTKADKNRARVLTAIKARQEQIEMQSALIIDWLDANM